MKLLTFLGTRPYEEVIYCLPNGNEYPTRFFAEALVSYFSPGEVLVFLTKEAAASPNWPALRESLNERSRVVPIHIPSGQSESELWEIFTAMTKQLNEGEEIVFDVTHAFRSLPLLALLAAVYLRAAKSVKLRSILYGAYEARDAQGRAPTFDLTPFLELLDWTTATTHFIKTGDAAELATLLEKAHNEPWKKFSSSETHQALPTQLKKLSTTFKGISRALQLVRPREVAHHAALLVDQLENSMPEVKRWALPFGVLLGKVREAYSKFAKDNLVMQLKLIQWYVSLERITQAIILAREWIITWACSEIAIDYLDKDAREQVEKALNEAVHQKKTGAYRSLLSKENLLLERLRAHPLWEKVVGIWADIRDLRNDVAHCGMRRQYRQSDAIFKGMERILTKLQEIPLKEAT